MCFDTLVDSFTLDSLKARFEEVWNGFWVTWKLNGAVAVRPIVDPSAVVEAALSIPVGSITVELVVLKLAFILTFVTEI